MATSGPGTCWSAQARQDRRCTGIVDWENAHQVGLPDTDLVHWWLAGQPVELGAAVRHALRSPEWADAELAALPVALPNPQLAIEDTVLLTWLGHVGAGLARADS